MTSAVLLVVAGAGSLAAQPAAAAVRPAAAGAGPRPLVRGGAPDGGAHPYVAMVIAPGLSAPNCTGVLVQVPNGVSVVLTDAHCLAGSGARSGTGVGVTFAPTWSASATVVRGSYFIDPMYNPQVSLLHDLAAVVLRPPAGTPHAELIGPGGSNLAAGSWVTVVGTGEPYPGERREATEVVRGENQHWVILGPGNGNSCNGDSGGPDLLQGTATIAALTDQGTCSNDLDTPVGTFEAHWFVDAASTASASAGLREPSLLGMTATRNGSDVTVVGASRFLNPAAGRYQGWTTNPVFLQRWTRRGWATIDRNVTDGLGNLSTTVRIPFRVGLRLVCGSSPATWGSTSNTAVS